MTTLLVVLLFAFASISPALVLPRKVSPHTTCSVNRHNTAADAQSGIQEVLVQVQSSAPLGQNQCLYAITNSTYISICNGLTPGRTITVAEAQAGLYSIMDMCGSKNNYNGAHYSTDLSFKIYGITGSPRYEVPDNAHGTPEPDSLTRRASTSNICPNFGFNGVSRTDCRKGECPAIPNEFNKCTSYCEIRRTGFVGGEEEAPPPWGQVVLPGNSLSLEEGMSTTTTWGVSVELSAGFWEAITAGVGFDYSTEETLVKSTTLAGEVSDKYRSRWVYFPLFIETCGTIRRKEPRNWAACWFQNDCCEAGTQMRYDNICYTGVMEVDGAAQVIWAQRFEYADGSAVPMHLQSKSYRGLCGSNNNPDGDPELECSADVEEPKVPEETPQEESPCLKPPNPGAFMNIIPGSGTECYFKMHQCHNPAECYLEAGCQTALDNCLAAVTAQG